MDARAGRPRWSAVAWTPAPVDLDGALAVAWMPAPVDLDGAATSDAEPAARDEREAGSLGRGERAGDARLTVDDPALGEKQTAVGR